MPGVLPRLDYDAYAQRLLAHRPVADVSVYGEVVENGRTYPLYELLVDGGGPLVIVTSGFHGEERSGPLTLATRFDRIAAHARERGVTLRVFPCINPSGFEAGRRYNASGEKPNNDFLRYEVAPGFWKGELDPNDVPGRHVLYDGGPRETRALRSRLEALPTPVAALDIHQDHHLHGDYVYAYVFGDFSVYRRLIAQSATHARIAADVQVDDLRRTDADGLIAFHDGSITDYYWRRGARFTAALETTTSTPAPASETINHLWVEGFIDLAAGQVR